MRDADSAALTIYYNFYNITFDYSIVTSYAGTKKDYFISEFKRLVGGSLTRILSLSQVHVGVLGVCVCV